MIRRAWAPMASRGATLIELMVSLALLTCVSIAALQLAAVMGNGMKSEGAHSNLETKTSGTLYDIGFELRQATAYSPHFAIEQREGMPPSITFDLIAGVDSKGNLLWGSKVCYRLIAETEPVGAGTKTTGTAKVSYLGITMGQLIREETDNHNHMTTSLVDEHVPYQFIEGNVAKWGFNVNRNDCALTVTVSKFADAGVNVNKGYTDAGTGAATGERTIIVTHDSTFYLRNPQVVTFIK